MRREYEINDEGWILIFDAPMYDNFNENIHNITPTIYNVSIENNSLAIKDKMDIKAYYSAAVYNMPEDYTTSLINSNELKIEIEIFPKEFYYASANSNNYTSPLLFGKYGYQYTHEFKNVYDENTQSLIVRAFGNRADMLNDARCIYPYNRWYHLVYSWNENSNGKNLVYNLTNEITTDLGSTTYPNWFSGVQRARAQGVTLFSQRYAGGERMSGYFKNLKIYVK